MTEITEGQKLTSYAFGEIVVRRTYKHPDTKELVAEVKAMESVGVGTSFHLSLAYVTKLMRGSQ
jgi:hypothetical protein